MTTCVRGDRRHFRWGGFYGRTGSRGRRRRPRACGTTVGAFAGKAPTAARAREEGADGRVRTWGTTVGACAGARCVTPRPHDFLSPFLFIDFVRKSWQ